MKIHSSLTESQVVSIIEAREVWRDWSASESRMAEHGLALTKSAATGYQVVAAFDMELATGLPHCSCCLKPLKTHY